MNVGELRLLLEGIDDNVQVLIPVSKTFDGRFYSPAFSESGATYLGSEPKC